MKKLRRYGEAAPVAALLAVLLQNGLQVCCAVAALPPHFDPDEEAGALYADGALAVYGLREILPAARLAYAIAAGKVLEHPAVCCIWKFEETQLEGDAP